MNYYKTLICITLITLSAGIYGADISFRQATLQDAASIELLLAASSSQDRTKIVILPDHIQPQTIKDTIEKGRYYVGCSNNKLIAVKKLFILSGKELQETLQEEIRAQSSQQIYKEPQERIIIRLLTQDELIPNDTLDPLTEVAHTHFIYNGADYTDPKHRNQGINTNLTSYALATLREKSLKIMSDEKKHAFCLLYGLVSYAVPKTILATRTASIAKIFGNEIRAILKTLNRNCDEIKFDCARFPAFKPEFAPDGAILPDEQCVPGHGYMLTYRFEEKS